MKFLRNLETADILAIILIIGVVASNLTGAIQQFMIPQSLLIIVGYYFGRRIQKNGGH